MIWRGAEVKLVTPQDRLLYHVSQSFGANAREHCRLFVVASAFVKACEVLAYVGEIEEDRMMVDGVLASLMNVRGFDAESIAAEKKAMAEAVALHVAANKADAPQAERLRERLLRRSKNCKMLEELEPSQKAYHHKVFVGDSDINWRDDLPRLL